jgi:VIT1/CCC1 family predicted Fe2+/Mn2+ transporter
MLKHYIRDLVYGANDGIITTFAVVAGVVGARLEPRVILIIGAASLVADGFSMAASDFLACRSHQAMSEEQGNSDDPCVKPVTSASYTFLAFVAAGAIPLLPYVLPGEALPRFWLAAAMTGVALFVVGLLRTLVTRRNPLAAGGEMLAIGGAAAVMAYGVGHLISTVS